MCVKNNITCSELWVDDDFEIIAVENKGSDPKTRGKSQAFTEHRMRAYGLLKGWLTEPDF
jgi:hypothetical protein